MAASTRGPSSSNFHTTDMPQWTHLPEGGGGGAGLGVCEGFITWGGV